MYGLFMLQLHATELTLALALFQVVGTMNIDAESLLLATLAKSLVGLGYQVEVSCFAMLCTDCLFGEVQLLLAVNLPYVKNTS
jgi:hypothetical protein